MAFTERYVTDAAVGTGDGTSGDPWTLAQALTNADAGDRVNIQSDSGYSLAADTVSNPGNAAQAIVFRGYNSSIGDLEGQGRNADGTLNTTNFPVITLTGTLTLNVFVVLEALVFTGSIAGHLVGDSGPDNTHVIQCSITNTANSASAYAFRSDNQSTITNSDCECSGASSNTTVDGDNNFRIIGCRIKSVGGVHLALNYGLVLDTVIFGNATGVGIQIRTATIHSTIYGCTISGVGIAISTAASASLYPNLFINNHITGCVEYLNNGYSGTANEWAVEVNNRTRDNTTGRTGIGDGIAVGEITTDTGGDETDFVAAGSENFRLISAAPGKAAGMVAYDDCGAYQREEAGAGGGGLLVHPGTSGGARG